MKTNTHNALPLFFSLFVAIALPAQVAITEFIDDVNGAEAKYEWVELYNYSKFTVSMEGWTLSDDDNESANLTNFTIASGEFALLASSKSDVENRWFGGVSQANVYEVSPLTLHNKKDELVLRDAQGDEVWRLAYDKAGDSGRATFLAQDDFSISDYGSKALPGIDRDGFDLGGTLGYESNGATFDALAFAAGGDFASPLAGNYTAVPEPRITCVAMSVVAIAFSWFMRRRRFAK